MLQTILLTLTLNAGFQSSIPPAQATGTDCLLAAEKKRMSEQDKIDGRIKVYRDISERYHKAILAAVAKRNFDNIETALDCWKDQLGTSMKDIDANINRKKKSAALISYEIQLRHSIVDIEDARLKATLEKQALFESWITVAQKIRDRFIDILFQR
jgi:hypothetical protein